MPQLEAGAHFRANLQKDFFKDILNIHCMFPLAPNVEKKGLSRDGLSGITQHVWLAGLAGCQIFKDVD